MTNSIFNLSSYIGMWDFYLSFIRDRFVTASPCDEFSVFKKHISCHLLALSISCCGQTPKHYTGGVREESSGYPAACEKSNSPETTAERDNLPLVEGNQILLEKEKKKVYCCKCYYLNNVFSNVDINAQEEEAKE